MIAAFISLCALALATAGLPSTRSGNANGRRAVSQAHASAHLANAGALLSEAHARISFGTPLIASGGRNVPPISPILDLRPPSQNALLTPPLDLSAFTALLTREDAANSTGFTFDPCLKAAHCSGIRRCFDVGNFPEEDLVLCTGDPDCLCVPPLLTMCTATSQCESGEVCATGRVSSFAVCVSALFESKSRTFNEIPKDPLASPPVPPSGLTFDFCQAQADCSGDRLCLYLGSPFISTANLCEARDPCLCFLPTLYQICTSSSQCPSGEECVRSLFLDEPGLICASRSTVRGRPRLFSTPPLPSPSLRPNSGLTMDACKKSFDCQTGRSCFLTPPSSGVACPGLSIVVCKCYPVVAAGCSQDAECATGEICAVAAQTGTRICISEYAIKEQPSLVQGGSAPSSSAEPTPSEPGVPSPTPSAMAAASSGLDTPGPATSPSPTVAVILGLATQPAVVSPSPSPISSAGVPTVMPNTSTSPSPQSSTQAGETAATVNAEGGVCIDARAVAHLEQSELVYEKHVLSKVLCDLNDSCATPGHMVIFKGKTMMMKMYCKSHDMGLLLKKL